MHAIRGVDYHFNEWGDDRSPTLFMLHGWGDCGASFQFTVDALAGDWRVIAPDWRGFGQSHLRAESYWFPDYVADLDALLEIYQPNEPVSLLGHSMGANVAGLYAGIMPERVAAFVNVEGFGLAESDPDNAPDNYRRWIEQSRIPTGYRRYDSFDALAARILKRSPRMGEERARFVARQWGVKRKDGRIKLRADPAHKLPNAVQYRRAEAEACWRRVTARVLLVAGSDSDFTKSARSWLDVENAALPFPGAQTVVIDESGHMLHFEQPARLAAVLEAFLSDA